MTPEDRDAIQLKLKSLSRCDIDNIMADCALVDATVGRRLRTRWSMMIRLMYGTTVMEIRATGYMRRMMKMMKMIRSNDRSFNMMKMSLTNN